MTKKFPGKDHLHSSDNRWLEQLSDSLDIREEDPRLDELIYGLEATEEGLTFLYGSTEGRDVNFGQHQIYKLQPEYLLWLQSFLLDRTSEEPHGIDETSLGTFLVEYFEALGWVPKYVEQNMDIKESGLQFGDAIDAFPKGFPEIQSALQLTPALLADLGYSVSKIFDLIARLGGPSQAVNKLAMIEVAARIRAVVSREAKQEARTRTEGEGTA